MRPESYKIDYDSIKVLSHVDAKNKTERFNLISSLISASMEEIYLEQKTKGKTLGIFKPKLVTELKVEETSSFWTEKEKMILNQLSFDEKEIKPLEKIPYDFTFSFKCDDVGCKGHNMKITDWEICQAYRNFKAKYGEKEGINKLKEKYLGWFADTNTNTYFIVGTVHRWETFIIIGIINIDKYVADYQQISLF